MAGAVTVKAIKTKGVHALAIGDLITKEHMKPECDACGMKQSIDHNATLVACECQQACNHQWFEVKKLMETGECDCKDGPLSPDHTLGGWHRFDGVKVQCVNCEITKELYG